MNECSWEQVAGSWERAGRSRPAFSQGGSASLSARYRSEPAAGQSCPQRTYFAGGGSSIFFFSGFPCAGIGSARGVRGGAEG